MLSLKLSSYSQQRSIQEPCDNYCVLKSNKLAISSLLSFFDHPPVNYVQIDVINVLFSSYVISFLVLLLTSLKSNFFNIYVGIVKVYLSSLYFCFVLQMKFFDFRSNNPILLNFLRSIQKLAVSDPELRDLTSKTLAKAPDLVLPYTSRLNLNLEPRDSEPWLNSIGFLIEVCNCL